MRHRHSRLRLRQKPAHSRLIQRNLVTSVLLYESVRTTKKRAQVVRPQIEKIITIAKTRDTRNAIRQIQQVILHPNACRKTMEVLKDRYADRTSGYTRIVPLGSRKGDGAELVTLSLVEGKDVAAPEKATKGVKATKVTKKMKSDSSATTTA
jgi:large subunit ribosomal protein L17